MLFLIVGLGNPGQAYSASRHNMGFEVLDRLAVNHGAVWEREAGSPSWLHARCVIEEARAQLLKPLTYMNLSGSAVQPVQSALRVPAGRIAVVHDDLDLILGRIQVRRGGGHGGHRGLKSVIEALEESEMVRVRIGVGRPAEGGDVTEHVLEAFGPEEVPLAHAAAIRASEAVATWIRDGLTTAMNRYNPWPPRGDDEGTS